MIMGKEGLGVMNENGEMFTDFCTFNSLVIGGSVFPHKRIHKVTWISPDHRTENQIDHICINSTFRRSLQDVRNKKGADVGSDHHLLVGTIRLKFKNYQNNNTNKTCHKYDTELLREKNIKQEFHLELSNRYQALSDILDEESSVEQQWEHTRNVWRETCDKVVGKKTRQHKEWISTNTLAKIKERKDCKAVPNNSKTRAAKAEAQLKYNEKHKEVKRCVKSDRRNFIDNLAKAAEEAAGKKNMKEVYDITRKLAGNKHASEKPVKNKSGEIITDEKEQLERWKEHFEELLNRPIPTDRPVITPRETPLNINTSKPSKLEIKRAISLLKNGKATGPDGVPAEAIKADTNISVEMMHNLLGKIWDEENVPTEWKHGYIIKLPKKGDLGECKNWRGITLLSVPSKILNRILLERMKTAVDTCLRDEQAGFRQNRSCTDQITILRIIIEQSIEWNSSLYVCFVDFEKAFDSIDRSSLWKLLQHHGIPEKLINIIRSAYEPSTCQVIHKNALTQPFNILTGVRQGCLLSPFLFLLAVNWVMETTTIPVPRGIQWTLQTHLEDLDFADDIALLSQKHKDMELKTATLKQQGQNIGLHINHAKTKTMRINALNSTKFKISEKELDDVDKFTYLGSVVSSDGGTDRDIKARIGKAAAVFKTLRPIWTSAEISKSTKLKIFNSNVKSVLLYASETWRTTKAAIHKIRTFSNRCLRNILKIK